MIRVSWRRQTDGTWLGHSGSGDYLARLEPVNAKLERVNGGGRASGWRGTIHLWANGLPAIENLSPVPSRDEAMEEAAACIGRLERGE